LLSWVGHPDISYHVPIGAAVLMVSLGADYNLFLVGRIWGELDGRSVGGAIRSAAPRAARSIATRPSPSAHLCVPGAPTARLVSRLRFRHRVRSADRIPTRCAASLCPRL